MINTQLAFLTATALSNLNEHINLDELREKYGVTDEQIEKARKASNNHVVRSEVGRSISQIVEHVESEGVRIRDLYASTKFVGGGKDVDRKVYTLEGVVPGACHTNCHGNCHGSRGWR